MSQQFQSAAVRGRGKPKECYPVFQQGCDSSQSRSWWVPHREWAGMSCAPGLWVLMKAQARGSCAPPPTCSLCLDKKPKTIKKPQRKPGRQQGQHSQGSSAASMSQGVPGWGGQWRWPRPPGELVAGSNWVSWWQDQLHPCPRSPIAGKAEGRESACLWQLRVFSP